MTSRGFSSKIGTIYSLAVLATTSARLQARNERELTPPGSNPGESANSRRMESSILDAANDDSRVDLGVALPPDIEELLPRKSEVADLYGPAPIIHGLDTCEAFRNSVAPEDRFLAVAGLFNTGTHLLSQLLGQNCALPESEKRGEKHSIPGHDLEDGMLFSVFWHKHAPVSYRPHMVCPYFDKFSEFIRFNQMPIVMMKDPLFWMSSMCKKPNCIDSLRKQLRQDEYCPRLVGDDNKPIPATGDYRVFPNATAEFATFEYESLLDMWESYYKEYRDYENPHLIVRYEDLIFHGENVIKEICTCAGGTMKNEYSPVSSFAKKGVQSRFDDSNKYLAHAASFYGSKSEREKVLKTREDEEFARKALDPEFLAEFRYQTPTMASMESTLRVALNENEKQQYGQTGEGEMAGDQMVEVQVRDEKGIQYLTFGASITWGSGMKDRFQAYPFLLSPDVTNLAIRASGPVYPSLCTESMVGDARLYDVIILEYHTPINGLIQLARRVRQRFPDAIIIFYRYWYPYQIYDPVSNDNVVDWAKNNDHGGLHSESFKNAFLNSNINWRWRDVSGVFGVQDQASSEVDGHILSLTKPEDPKDFLNYADWISYDWLHLSESGHKFVEKGICEIVDSIGVVSRPRLGTWGAGDSCLSWFESGECPLEHSDNIEMERVGPTTKHALTIRSEGGTVTVDNPSDQPLELYLSYMTTSPSPSKYPKTEVTIAGTSSSVILDPLPPSTFGFDVHVSITTSVGMINPGANLLSFKPLEETEWPFRLISITMTGKDEDMKDKYVTNPQFRGDTVLPNGR